MANNRLPILPGSYSQSDIPAVIDPWVPPFDYEAFVQPAAPGDVVEVGVLDIGPFFGGMDQPRWFVDLPWWLGGGSISFATEQEAIDFVNKVLYYYAWWQTHKIQMAVGGVCGVSAFMSFKHPKEMAGVVQALSDLFTGTLKGIGEVIPG